MQHILVLGAGLSSSALIRYLLQQASQVDWRITVADVSKKAAEQKIDGSLYAMAVQLDVANETEVQQLIKQHDLVLSLLPPMLHVAIARQCIAHQKHLVTASYITPEMQALHQDAAKAGVLLLNECGLDPGIDHLSAMKIIDEIHAQGGEVTSFKSFCGGLVAPEFDDNPWNYKFTWNPRNVVLAGQATAKYLEKGIVKYIPPRYLFENLQEVNVNGLGVLEGYANRDSLNYITPYGIETAHTVLRGTLRMKGFCEAWNLLVKLGLTDDTFTIEHANTFTYRSLLNAFVPGTNMEVLEQRTAQFLQLDINSEAFDKLRWLGICDKTPIALAKATPAQILQQLLQQKWKLNEGELDMIVMKHEIQYTTDKPHTIISELVVKGESQQYTAMANTVGLPMAIAAKLILLNKIDIRGVAMPLHKQFYEPILIELSTFGITFSEKEI
jgi:saccharopine dehydrogenase-like NADP-dependent oxidoreductase